MSNRVEVSAQTLREWSLPEPDESKYARGQVVVVGGALRSPGAATLAGVAALRVGAGRLTLAVGKSVAAHIAVATVESGVVPLDETPGQSVSGFSLPAASDDLRRADTVLLGPGLDDADEAEVMVRELPRYLEQNTVVVLDAFGLGVLPSVPGVADALGGRLVLTPNKVEAGLLLERELDDLETDLLEIARRYSAVVCCYGVVAAPTGDLWVVGTRAGSRLGVVHPRGSGRPPRRNGGAARVHRERHARRTAEGAGRGGRRLEPAPGRMRGAEPR
jgi:ADP-dependent NAD(P)H-hydrate dehydratase